MAVINTNEEDIQLAFWKLLNTFGMSLDPNDIVKGQVNRVAEPTSNNFLVFWLIDNTPLSYPIPSDHDNIITASIYNSLLTVTSISQGSITTGTMLFSPNLPTAGIKIFSQKSGEPGNVGTYLLTSPAPNLKSQTFYCGVHSMLMPTQLTYQCDVHGPNSYANSQILYTCWKDGSTEERAWQLGLPIHPLDASYPKQIPFTNAEQEWEERWVVDLMLQVNPIINTGQQFASTVDIKLNVVNTYGDDK